MLQLNHKEKRLLAFYLIWVMINILLWVISGDGGSNYFWPFDGIEDIEDYSAAEFFLYTLFPIGMYIVYRLLKNSDTDYGSDKQSIRDSRNNSTDKPLF